MKSSIKASVFSVPRHASNPISIVINDRIKSGNKRGDLLDLMLSGKDSQTGEGLDEENVRYQVCHLTCL
jgi:hypothetical protein